MGAATILITRPAASARSLAATLGTHGYRSIVSPLLTIAPTHAPPPPDAIAAVMLTSANALAVLGRDALAAWLPLPCFCVGDHTAAAAREKGFTAVTSYDGDGARLAAGIRRDWPPAGRTILHLCGTHTAGAATDALAAAGYRIIRWPVYQALPVAALTPEATDALRQSQLAAALFFSPRTARRFVALAEQGALQACCASLIGIGLSEAVTAELQPLPWRRLAAAAQPHEAALIECLRQTIAG